MVDMPLKDGVAAGLVLSNSKDTIVNCFGFRETFVRNDCIMWKKLNNGTWEEPKEIDFEESTRIVLDRLFAEDQQYFHYPTYTYCQVSFLTYGVSQKNKKCPLREAFKKKTGYFMTLCKKVGR